MGPRAPVWALTLLLGSTFAADATQAFAQDRREPPAEAVEFYRSGRAHFAAGRYREAIEDLERALTLDPGSATLAYNLARVHELLGELEPAIQYYATYVRLLPESEREERERIDETIRRLEGARDELGEPTPHEGPPPAWDDAEEPRWVTERGVIDVPFWIAAGATAALLVGGTVVGLLALDRESTAERFVLGSDGSIEERDAIANDADNFALAADLLLLGAGAGLVATVLLYGLRSRTYELLPEHQPEAFVATDGSVAVLGVRGRL